MEPTTIVGILDRAGIFAFAFAGAAVGMRRHLDILGILVMGLVTATGGGVLRDVMLQRLPLLFTHADYVFIAIAGSLAAIPLITRRSRLLGLLLLFADAGGLGAFAAAGAVAGHDAGLEVVPMVLLAILTACGGGVIRDLFADEVPLLLRAELSATAAAVGGFVTWLLADVAIGGAALIATIVTATLRVLSVVLRLHLPVPGAARPPEA